MPILFQTARSSEYIFNNQSCFRHSDTRSLTEESILQSTRTKPQSPMVLICLVRSYVPNFLSFLIPSFMNF